MAPSRVALLLSCLVVARLALADQRQPGWSFTPLLGTDVGVDLAAGIQVETPARLRLMATVGWTPRTYAWLLKKAYLAMEDDREALGNILQEVAEHALVLGGNFTMRPFLDHGFFFGASYHAYIVDKQGLFAAQLENAIDEYLPPNAREASEAVLSRRFDLDADLHVVGALLGWQWGLGPGLMFRVSLGVLAIVSSDLSFEPQYSPSDPATTQLFIDDAEEVIEDAATGTFAPSFSLYLGYTF